MGMNIVEKILARAGGMTTIAPGDFVVVNVDTTVLYDNNFAPLYWRDALKVADPDKIVVAYDHRVPPPDKASAQAQVVGRAFVEKFGIKRFHDIGREQGISHVVVADNGYALPGTVLVCSVRIPAAAARSTARRVASAGPTSSTPRSRLKPGSASIRPSATTSSARLRPG